jgi:hypothetical protein
MGIGMGIETEADPAAVTNPAMAAAAAATAAARIGPGMIGTGAGATADLTTARNAELDLQRVALAWDPIFRRIMASRNSFLQAALVGQTQTSARPATMGRILTATPLDGRERGIALRNDDHSTTLPEGRVHGRGYEMEFFQPSELPLIGNEADVTRILISGATTGYDPDKFQMDAAFHVKLSQDEAQVCSKMPLVTSVALVARPSDMLDVERCEVMEMLRRVANFLQVVFRAMVLRDHCTAYRWAWSAWALVLDQRDEMWGRKVISDGGSNEMLLLRHTENSTVPFGLRQLSYQLDRERSRFFRTGGAVVPAGSQTDSSSTAQWPGFPHQTAFLPSQSPSSLPSPTTLALSQYLAPAALPLPSGPALPSLALPPTPSVPLPSNASSPPQRVVLELNVNQRSAQPAPFRRTSNGPSRQQPYQQQPYQQQPYQQQPYQQNGQLRRPNDQPNRNGFSGRGLLRGSNRGGDRGGNRGAGRGSRGKY